MTQNDRVNLLNWFKDNQRPLPWRKNRDPYRIWISETMLQQTTTEAVKPYYERFLKRFPSVKDLAQASLEDVYEFWAGLGYYSRARNLHKAAQIIAEVGFKKDYVSLMEWPGFGPYTARAVSSIAFDENVGVLDGNVIRVLARKNNLALEWWKPAERRKLQALADDVVMGHPPHLMNQAMMELGATICLPRNPKCLICPWFETCLARKKGTVESVPLKKKPLAFETWIWRPELHLKSGKLLLIKNEEAPFLKNAWLLPGEIKKAKAAPRRFTFRHSITRYDIFVDVQKNKDKNLKISSLNSQWVELKQVTKISPFSLMTKVLKSIEIKK